MSLGRTAGKWQASASGGGLARWRSDGRELYYVQDRTLMAVSVSAELGFTLGQPQALFASPDIDVTSFSAQRYAVSADGQRFLTVTPVEDQDQALEQPKIHVVLNWYEEFRDREQN
jgi:hypothetical protein